MREDNTIFSGGFIGLFSMHGAYHRWCPTTSIWAQYFEKMLEVCDLMDKPDSLKARKHRELDRGEVKKSEEAVQRTISAIQNFTNPFTLVDKEHLYSLASGAPTSLEVEFDVLLYMQRQLVRNPRNLSSKITLYMALLRSCSLSQLKKLRITVLFTCSSLQVLQCSTEQSDIVFMLLIKSQNLDEPLNFDELMQYSLFPVPPSLGTVDGFFNKTNKAAMLHYLMEDAEIRRLNCLL